TIGENAVRPSTMSAWSAMKINRFHITCRLIGSLKSAAFTDMGAWSLGDVDHEIAIDIDVSRAARPDDRGRLPLLDDRRPLDRLADGQFVMIVDRRIDEAAALTEVDRARALPGLGGMACMRPGHLILLAAGAQAPGDHLDG